MKLLIGGSPCTYWSIAQTRCRETSPEGLGWELFKNYLIAKTKFQPDYFLYENNKSIAKEVQAQITKELGVEPILINSALLSAQSRKRLYWTNIPNVKQPANRDIALCDILESGVAMQEKSYCITATEYKGCTLEHYLTKHVRTQIAELLFPDENLVSSRGRSQKAIYEVRNGLITICGKQHHIQLADGYYTIRKLTGTECKRLQTVPDEYEFPVSDAQAYKMLGNGWTVDVIAHILHYTPRITTDPIIVLSMYDGMSCGRLALNKLGAKIEKYYATEIDKYAVQTTLRNFPDTIQLGDAFQVRKNAWSVAS